LRTIIKSVIGAVLILSSGAILLVGGRRIIEQERMAEEVDRLREGLYRARATAERCQRSIVAGETELLELRARLDLLRARVDSFEALDERGVPQDRYETYLGTFTMYNDTASTWEERERQLRVAEASCRTVILEHNAKSDSLQSLFAELGVD
jgi:predicted  nucleic acid-binding Zn-ribbon protein